MESQWVQWVPLFGFGSVLTILMAIFGVGIGLWRNASIAHRNISDNIARVESRLQTQMGSLESKLQSQMGTTPQGLAWNPSCNPKWEAWSPDWNPDWILR